MKKGLRSTALAITALLNFGIAASHATEQYRAEVSAFYTRANGRQDFESILYGVSGQIFFVPVNTEEHPYAEAAFLERIGNAVITAVKEETKTGSAKDDGPIGSIGVHLSQPDFPLAADLAYLRSRFDSDGTGGFVVKNNVYDVRVGNYFAKTLLAGLEYSYGSVEVSSILFPSSTARSRNYGLFAKYINELGDHKELSFEATLGKSTIGNSEISRNTDESISVDFFFNKSLSIGIGFRNSSGTDEFNEGKTYSGNIRYFISPRFSVQAIFDTFRNPNGGQFNTNTYELILAGRY